MPFTQSLSLRSRAVIAALGIALASLAAPACARADALDGVPAGDEALVAGAAALDDGTLARQRGTGPGLMTVGAPMLALHGAPSVTLWDEIAPPAPVPVPADSSHVAQSNTVSYFRQ
ncbi:hypothetical protein [Trinickia diaoshuihuensis]|uniref:hypothetical protein n=1 Tax=Trinickia diaoshuihuensis TaxID=2292265 RepID=UPI000E223A67|nr:hypothetical protein [Trinickia diaoshuihuensis]